MWNVWETEQVPIGFRWGDLSEEDQLEDLGVGWRIILKWIFKKWCGKTWRGLIWLGIWTGSGRIS